ncbi:MAG TPA: ABC transporter permease [Bryobacteraceae bacterium]|nr:ABC transporter permease [Bryobacteraceae bacterium]
MFWLRDAIQDLRYGARTLRRTPGFTAITALILALGIGATTAVFSVVNAALLAPLPFQRPGDLFVLYEKTPATTRFTVSYPNFLDWQHQNQTFETVAACRPEDFVLVGEGKTESLHAAMISAELFTTLGIKPLAGRSFQPDDDRIGTGRVVMLDEDFWRERFGSSPAAIGGVLRLRGSAYTIIGVAPRSLRTLGRMVGPARMYVPLGQWEEPTFRDRKVTTGMLVVARRKPGISEASARADLSRVAANLAAAFPDADRDVGITMESLQETLVFRVRTTLLAVLGGVALVLLIACADVANLVLVRSAGRSREFTTRTALGAGAFRLARQLVAESLLLSAMGGVLGLALAWFGLKAAVLGIPADIPRAAQAGLDSRVLLCAFGLSTFAALVCGLAPTLRILRNDLSDALKEGARGSSGRGHRAQAVFVVVQMSLALVLLAGSSLMIRSVANLWKVTPGFDARNVLTFQVMPPPVVASQPAAIRASFRNLTSRLQALQGVEGAAVILDPLPLSGVGDVVRFQREGQIAPEEKSKPSALWYHVGPEYFRVMRIALLRGRLFTDHDDERASRVMIIDRNLAASIFGQEDPLGKRLDIAFIGPAEIVGIVGHVNHWNVGGDPKEWVTRQMYFPHMQLAGRWLKLGVTGGFSVVARTRGEPLALVGAIREATRTDAEQAIYGEQSMDQIVERWLATRRFLMMLLSAFAVLALLLACAGLYGVLSYAVGERTQELGIRMALGAQRAQILKLVFSYGGKLVLSGIAIGNLAALASMRLIASLLYGVTASDPFTFAAVAGILMAMAAAACYLPARRAMRIDPITALR